MKEKKSEWQLRRDAQTKRAMRKYLKSVKGNLAKIRGRKVEKAKKDGVCTTCFERKALKNFFSCRACFNRDMQTAWYKRRKARRVDRLEFARRYWPNNIVEVVS